MVIITESCKDIGAVIGMLREGKGSAGNGGKGSCLGFSGFFWIDHGARGCQLLQKIRVGTIELKNDGRVVGRGNTGNARKPPLLRIIDVPLLLVIGIHSFNIHKHQRCLRGNVIMCHTFKYKLDVAGLELTSRAAAEDTAVMEKNVRT